MKKIEMVFYKTNPSEKNTGMKFVLFEITTDESQVINDWGFADWNGKSWDPVEKPAGFTCEVVYWSNTVDPKILLEDKRIVTLG